MTEINLYRVMLQNMLAVLRAHEETRLALDGLRTSQRVKQAIAITDYEIAHHRNGIAMLKSLLGYDMTDEERAMVAAEREQYRQDQLARDVILFP